MSHTNVLTSQVRSACANYLTHRLSVAWARREECILEAMNDKIFGTYTREQAIKNLENDPYQWVWHFNQAHNVEQGIKNRIGGLLAMCDLSINGMVTLDSEDCGLVNSFKD